MKDNTHNDLDELLKRMMIESDDGDAAAEAFWEAQEESVLQGEPTVVPTPEKEAAMVAKLQAAFPASSTRGGFKKIAGIASVMLLICMIGWLGYNYWPAGDASSQGSVAVSPIAEPDEITKTPIAEQNNAGTNAADQSVEGNNGSLAANDNAETYTPTPPAEGSLTAANISKNEKPATTTDLPPDLVEDEATFMQQLNESLATYNKALPAERVYVHTDKSIYRPNETLWFSAYLLNEDDLQASTQSDILTAVLINPKGKVVDAINLITKDGKSTGDFTFKESFSTGTYSIKAFTHWQRNDQRNLIFSKDVLLQPATPPQVLLSIDHPQSSYLPGDMVEAQIDLASLDGEVLSKKAFTYSLKIDKEVTSESKATTDRKGRAVVKFRLPEDISNEKVLLNVMVQQGDNMESFFRKLPIAVDSIQFEMYPEGGDLLAGLIGRVGFQALDMNGHPIDVAGKVKDQKGKVVAEFESLHDGMGVFAITPHIGEQYSVEITQPVISNNEFPFPAVSTSGIMMNVFPKHKQLLLAIGAREAQDVSVNLLIRGEIYYQTTLQLDAGSNLLTISTDKFPIGVAQITLFDQNGVEQAERLTFVNKHKQLQVSVSTAQQAFGPSDKVEMTVAVHDEDGLPVAANLSLSVVDERFVDYRQNQSGNILSKLLLEADISGSVHDPAFYFSENEAKANDALDVLLMTRGWRRFTWKEVLHSPTPTPQYEAKKAVVAGLVKSSNGLYGLQNVKITALEQRKTLYSQENGQFSINDLELIVPQTLRFEYHGEVLERTITDYNQHLEIIMPGIGYDYNVSANTTGIEGTVVDQRSGKPIPIARVSVDGMDMDVSTDINGRFLLPLSPGKHTLNIHCSGFESTQLQASIAPDSTMQITVRLEENLDNVSLRTQQSPISPITVDIANAGDEARLFPVPEKEEEPKQSPPVFYYDHDEPYSPYYQIDWVRQAFEGYEKVDKNEQQPITVKQYPEEQPFNAENYQATYDEYGRANMNYDLSTQAKNVPKYYRGREFPKVVYTEDTDQQVGPYQATTYWDGNIQTGEDGTATIEYIHNGGIGNYNIVVEGVSANGRVGRQETHYDTQSSEIPAAHPFSLPKK